MAEEKIFVIDFDADKRLKLGDMNEQTVEELGYIYDSCFMLNRLYHKVCAGCGNPNQVMKEYEYKSIKYLLCKKCQIKEKVAFAMHKPYMEHLKYHLGSLRYYLVVDEKKGLAFGKDLYRALCNRAWIHDESRIQIHVEWRDAAELVASTRGKGDYRDFFNCGKEGQVKIKIKKLMRRIGYSLVEDSTNLKNFFLSLLPTEELKEAKLRACLTKVDE